MLLISVESAADRDVAFSRLEPFLSVISRGSWTIRVPSDWIAVPVVGGLHFLDFEEIGPLPFRVDGLGREFL